MAFRGRRDDGPAGSGANGPLIALLGRGCRFEGRLSFEGTVQINGDFHGEIVSDDTVIIGEGANVHAEIDVGSAVVTGTIVGTVRARRAIEVHRPGRIQGDVYTPELTVEPGVVLEGQVRMENLDAAFAQRGIGAPKPQQASMNNTPAAKEPGLPS